jgi:hypothetical protein
VIFIQDAKLICKVDYAEGEVRVGCRINGLGPPGDQVKLKALGPQPTHSCRNLLRVKPQSKDALIERCTDPYIGNVKSNVVESSSGG